MPSVSRDHPRAQHLLVTRTFPPMIGGIERFVSQLFARSGVPVHAVAPAVPGADAFDTDAPYPVSRYFYTPRWREGKAPVVPMTLQTAATALRVRPRLLFCDQIQSTAAAVPVARLLGAQVVTFAHAMELTPARAFQAKQWGFRHSAAVIANSRFTRDEVMKVYGVPANRITLCRPGVDVARFAPPGADAEATRARRARMERGAFELLTVGRLSTTQPYKGCDRVIRLLARLTPSVPGARLTVVGDGNDRARLETLARELGVAERVTFAGAVSDAALPGFYHRADLFLLPSGASEASYRVEGYGIVYAEAAAAGVPSVGYRLGGAVDAIEANVTGVVCDPSEEALLADVENLLHRPDRLLAMRTSAQAHATAHLGWDSAISALRALVDRLAPGTAGEHPTTPA